MEKIKKRLGSEELERAHKEVMDLFRICVEDIQNITDKKPVVRAKAYLKLMTVISDYLDDYYDHLTEINKLELQYIQEQNKIIMAILTFLIPQYIGDPISVFERQKIMERPVSPTEALIELALRFLGLNVNPEGVKALLEAIANALKQNKGGQK